jgi:hypothetical protein
MSDNVIDRIARPAGEGGQSSPSSRLATEFMVLTLAGLVVSACHPTEPHYPIQPLSPECRLQGRLAEYLGALAYQSLSVYGRIDPGVYTLGDDNRLQIGGDVPGIQPERAAEFKRAFEKVSADAEALDALTTGYKQARELCAGNCPPTRHAVTLAPQSGCGSTRVYWHFEGPEVPDALSLKAFKTLYQPQSVECEFGPPVYIANATDGNLSLRHFFGSDCNCTRDDNTDGEWKRDSNNKRYCGSC